MEQIITSVEVFKKIKMMSRETLNPTRRILVSDLLHEIPVAQDALLVLLVELEDRGLIRIHKAAVVSLSLTAYGIEQENPPGGLSNL